MSTFDRLIAVMTIGSFVWGLGSGILLDWLKKIFPNVATVVLWIFLVVVSVLILLSIAVILRRRAKQAEYQKCGRYLELVWRVLYTLRPVLQRGADELAHEQGYEPGAQNKLKPVIANIETAVGLISASAVLMRNDQLPQVPALLRSIAEHTHMELVTPFNEPIDPSHVNAVERKVSRASWGVACVSLLTNQLMGVVVTHPRYPREEPTRGAVEAPGWPPTSGMTRKTRHGGGSSRGLAW